MNINIFTVLLFLAFIRLVSFFALYRVRSPIKTRFYGPPASGQNKKENEEKMVVFDAIAEIRGDFHNEQINLEARTVGGVQKPAFSFKKRFYPCEINDQPALLRFRDNVTVSEEFKKGQMVKVSFSAVEVEGDVTNVFALKLEPVKK
jgi:hypothetical protein